MGSGFLSQKLIKEVLAYRAAKCNFISGPRHYDAHGVMESEGSGSCGVEYKNVRYGDRNFQLILNLIEYCLSENSETFVLKNAERCSNRCELRDWVRICENSH